MPSPRKATFDAQKFLDAAGLPARATDFAAGETVYSQGEPADTVLYIQKGSVKLTVLSTSGKEAVIGVLGGGDFFGEGALTGQPVRLSAAVAIVTTRIRVLPKAEIVRLLHAEHKFSDRFIAHMLARNLRLEEDLVDQLFNASEKRLARTLLLLARYGKADGPRNILPKISQETLAEMVGTTRSRVNFFMNKFRKLGFIEYNGTIKVHRALLSVVLLDPPSGDH
jgi:CRP/FNR family transcriptional regulator, cyclic AMP receptor protein